jgi:hypothetical protein
MLTKVPEQSKYQGLLTHPNFPEQHLASSLLPTTRHQIHQYHFQPPMFPTIHLVVLEVDFPSVWKGQSLKENTSRGLSIPCICEYLVYIILTCNRAS